MPDTPRIPGLEPRFCNVGDDEVPFIKVRSQRNADGSESHVWEKWVAFSVEPLYLALFARWDPGMIVRHHGHHSPHTLTVLKGSFTCGDVELGPGGHIELPFGASFDAAVAGRARSGAVARSTHRVAGGPRGPAEGVHQGSGVVRVLKPVPAAQITTSSKVVARSRELDLAALLASR